MKNYSFIIPLKDDSLIFNSVDSFLGAENSENSECIIIFNGAKEDFQEQVKEKYNAHQNIRYIETDIGNISTARNYGVVNSEAKYVIFMDSDCYIKKNYINQLDKIAKDDYDIVLGSVEFDKGPDKFSQLNSWFHHYINKSSFGGFLFTPNLIVKRELFPKLGLFDEDLSGFEDGEWSDRILNIDKHDLNIKYDFSLVMNNGIEKKKHKHKSWIKYGIGFSYRKNRSLKMGKITWPNVRKDLFNTNLLFFQKGLAIKQRLFILSYLFKFNKGVFIGFNTYRELKREDFEVKTKLLKSKEYWGSFIIDKG